MLELSAFPKSLRFTGAALGALFLAVLLTQAAPAAAQDIQALQNQVERLQREVTDLQRTVYRGGSSSGSSVAELPANNAARLEIRISELEQSLRELRGQIEELAFQTRQNRERLDKLSADVDLRLSQLEGGAPAGMAAEQPPQAAPGTQSAQAGGGGQPTTAPQAGTLGQISESDLQRYQQQQQSAGGAPASSQAGGQTASAAPAPAQVTLPEGSPEAQYEFALGLLRQTRFNEAESALSQFLDKHPKHTLSPNAKYWLGETYYVRGNFQSAAVTFAEGFQEFPDGAKAPDNLLKLGMSLGQLGDKDNACATFAQLQQRFPTAPANVQQKAQLERQRLGCP